MEPKVNEIVLTKKEHGDNLFNVMGDLIRILVNSGYVCKVRADEPGLGIYVVEYESGNPEFTDVRLMWVDTTTHYIGKYGEEEDE